MSDALSNMELKSNGLFVKVKEGDPQTLRILTLDPLVSVDQWGNTRYSFIVYNWTAEKPQILSKGPGIVKQLQAIHLDPDFDALNKVDVKLIATGEGLETRYSVQVLPKARDLTSQMVKEAQEINLEEKIDNGIRLSKVNEGDEIPSVDVSDDLTGYDKAKKAVEKLRDPIIEDIGDEPINLEDIPF